MNRLHMGKLTYLGIGLRGLFAAELFAVRLVLDDSREEIFHDVLFASVHNLPYEGGGLKFSPDARPDDGFLNLCIVAGISKAKMIRLLSKVPGGKHIGCPGVYSFRCRKAEFLWRNLNSFIWTEKCLGSSATTAGIGSEDLKILG